MGHHIDREGRFQSDRYPDLDPDKIVVSFKHPQARRALAILADDYGDMDPGLAADIRTRLRSLGGQGKEPTADERIAAAQRQRDLEVAGKEAGMKPPG